MALALIVWNFLAALALTAAAVAGIGSARDILPVDVYPRTHVTLALFGAVMMLFGHSMTIFYFVGTGVRMKELVAEHGITEDLVTPTKRFKMKVFPFATMAMLITMITFIIGGGVDTGTVPSWVHLALATVALILNFMAMNKELWAINANVRLFDHLELLVEAKESPALVSEETTS